MEEIMVKRTHYTAEGKVKILREHLENQVSISELSERYGIHPNMLYKWKKELFEGALETFRHNHKKRNNRENAKTKALEEKLKQKDSLIAEIIEENIKLKKNTFGGI